MIGIVQLTGAQASAFTIGADGCANQTLAPGDACTVGVSFSPDGRRQRHRLAADQRQRPLRQRYCSGRRGATLTPVMTIAVVQSG
ncbi:MAG: hypothetical protein ACLP50_02200 [Solirubrobacteraceae bacterium]